MLKCTLYFQCSLWQSIVLVDFSRGWCIYRGCDTHPQCHDLWPTFLRSCFGNEFCCLALFFSGMPSLHETCFSRPKIVFQVVTQGREYVSNYPVVPSTIVSTWCFPWWSVLERDTICQAFPYLYFIYFPRVLDTFLYWGPLAWLAYRIFLEKYVSFTIDGNCFQTLRRCVPFPINFSVPPSLESYPSCLASLPSNSRLLFSSLSECGKLNWNVTNICFFLLDQLHK